MREYKIGKIGKIGTGSFFYNLKLGPGPFFTIEKLQENYLQNKSNSIEYLI